MLENIILVYAEKAKYMQSIPWFFIITVAAYPKGKLSTKDSDQVLSSNWHLPLYFSNYAISIWYIFIWRAHKKILFLRHNKNMFLWATNILLA